MRTDAKTRHEVLAVLNGTWKAYAARDPEMVLSFYASDPNVLAVRRAGGRPVLSQPVAVLGWGGAPPVAHLLNISPTVPSIDCCTGSTTRPSPTLRPRSTRPRQGHRYSSSPRQTPLPPAWVRHLHRILDNRAA